MKTNHSIATLLLLLSLGMTSCSTYYRMTSRAEHRKPCAGHLQFLAPELRRRRLRRRDGHHEQRHAVLHDAHHAGFSLSAYKIKNSRMIW